VIIKASIFKDPDNPKLNVSSPDIFPSKNVLKEEFRILSKRYSNEGVNFNKIFSGYYRLLDSDGKTEITVDELVDRYFGNPEDVFTKSYGNDSTLDTMVKAAVTNNIAYQMQVIQRQKNYFIIRPARNNVLTEFSNNSIEDSNISNTSNTAVVADPDTVNLPLILPPRPEPEPKAKVEGSFKCFYCDECFEGIDGDECNIKRVKHREQYHPDKPNYRDPEKGDFVSRLDR
jgi:hypothetical protein